MNPAAHKAQSIKNPSEKLAFTDTVDWWVSWEGADYKNIWDVIGEITVWEYQHLPAPNGPIWTAVMYRHNEGANVAFYDGHVTWMRKQEVWNDKNYFGQPKNPGMWAVDYGLYREFHD
jgi:prepilin-type processing-associated H-X9-DG protein